MLFSVNSAASVVKSLCLISHPPSERGAFPNSSGGQVDSNLQI